MRFLIFLTAFFVLSCASAPRENTYNVSWQKKIEATSHWNTLAKQVAKDVNCALQGGTTIAPSPQPTGFGHVVPETSGAVFVQDNDRSPFGNAIRTLVSQALLDRGIQITQNKQSSVVLDWEVQPITTSAERCSLPGLPEFLLVDLPWTLLLGEGENFCVPHAEVIITFLLRNDDVGIMRKSRLFYINGADVGLYWDTTNLNRTILVASPEPVIFQSVSQ